MKDRDNWITISTEFTRCPRYMYRDGYGGRYRGYWLWKLMVWCQRLWDWICRRKRFYGGIAYPIVSDRVLTSEQLQAAYEGRPVYLEATVSTWASHERRSTEPR